MKIAISFIIFILSTNTFASNIESVSVDNTRANSWNDFVANIYKLHLKQISNKSISITERSGSYHRQPDFFQEIKFFDTKSNNRLSTIEWETKQPDKIHSIEVLVHNNDNKVIREYSASYLPNFRNAPYQTLINLHHYSESLHSFRQFDASNNLLYEVCRSASTKEKLFEHDDYEIPDNFTQGVGTDKVYKQCFQQLPRTAAKYLSPH